MPTSGDVFGGLSVGTSVVRPPTPGLSELPMPEETGITETLCPSCVPHLFEKYKDSRTSVCTSSNRVRAEAEAVGWVMLKVLTIVSKVSHTEVRSSTGRSTYERTSRTKTRKLIRCPSHSMVERGLYPSDITRNSVFSRSDWLRQRRLLRQAQVCNRSANGDMCGDRGENCPMGGEESGAMSLRNVRALIHAARKARAES